MGKGELLRSLHMITLSAAVVHSLSGGKATPKIVLDTCLSPLSETVTLEATISLITLEATLHFT